jgi:hypothetical protein
VQRVPDRVVTPRLIGIGIPISSQIEAAARITSG